MTRHLALALAMVLLTACGDGDGDGSAAKPPPASLSDDAVGYYCGMLLGEHAGPKGQIRLASRAEPLWFSSARDAIAFTRMPLEPKDVTAFYVSDMGRAPSWQAPGADNWIAGEEAWFVIGSGREGGMGSDEAVPFASAEAAQDFAGRQGGRVVRLDDIPDSYVLGTAGEPQAPGGHDAHGGGS